MKVFGTLVPSFVGTLGASVREDGAVVRVSFLGSCSGEAGAERDAFARHVRTDGDELIWDEARAEPARAELDQYFRGRRKSFEVALVPRGTSFQLAVWSELERIPFGSTISYGELARRVGQPGASRAVGQANHVNPLPIFIP